MIPDDGRVNTVRGLCACTVMLAIGSLGALSGCQRGSADNMSVSPQDAGNHPPVIKAVAIQPHPLTLVEHVFAQVEAQDLDRNPLRFRYQWRINTHVVDGQDREQLPLGLLKQGDRVSVQVWPHDGVVEGMPLTSESIVVGNTPPVVRTLTFSPSAVFPGVRVQIRADIAEPDGDSFQVVYRWFKNNKVIQEGADGELDTTGYVRGDVVMVEAVATDRAGSGPAFRSAVLEIENSPPQILSMPDKVISGSQYRYQVHATDVESDPIVFSLAAAPSGMTIDPQKGLLTWTVTSSHTGPQTVRILVTDSHGASASQEFELTATGIGPTAPAGA